MSVRAKEVRKEGLLSGSNYMSGNVYDVKLDISRKSEATVVIAFIYILVLV